MVFYIHGRSKVLCVTLVLNYCVRGAAARRHNNAARGRARSRGPTGSLPTFMVRAFTRETSRYAPARYLFPSLHFSFSFLAAILIEPRYERIERSIGIDLLEDLWSSTRYYHSWSIITHETNDAIRCFTVVHNRDISSPFRSTPVYTLALDIPIRLILPLVKIFILKILSIFFTSNDTTEDDDSHKSVT